MKIACVASTIVVVYLAGWGATFAQGTLKVAVFDPQRVSEETEEGKKVQAELTTLRDKKQAELTVKERELTDLQNQMTAQGLSLSPDKKSSLEKEIQRRALDLQQAREAARNEIQFELASAQNKFQDKLLAVVEEFGREEGFTLILDRSMAAYAAASIDVTAPIVRRFNAAIKKPETSKPEAGTPAPSNGGGR